MFWVILERETQEKQCKHSDSNYHYYCFVNYNNIEVTVMIFQEQKLKFIKYIQFYVTVNKK